MMSGHFSSLAYAYGLPTASGQLKQSPSDFIVTEQLSFEPSGDGEHLFVLIKKIGLNTLDVCEQLAKHFHVHPRNITYAGLKDKNAITTQWFCFPFPIKLTADFNGFESESITVVNAIRNTKKLKRGAIKANKFEITLRNLSGELSNIEERIQLIKEHGVPNYFGAQRFGHNENNLVNVRKLFSGKIKCNRNKKSIYLSAARSFLFNEVLSQRIKNNTWNQFIDGDVAVLNNSRSFFVLDDVNAEIMQRLEQGDVHPSAPLWGKGEGISVGEANKQEMLIMATHSEYSNGLVQQGLQQDRRATRLFVNDLSYQFNDNNLILSFSLLSGSYATSVLREIINEVNFG
ncbi:tRNA pseudouridine(13) synthase [hydrothermal vent metagenome]|uniref:tRNA pseudouridine(13) synthase n=1 Tax=hydrothermal vent metagenome TaxID=652676 RepID=A0A3B1AC06_9ZZZZ